MFERGSHTTIFLFIFVAGIIITLIFSNNWSIGSDPRSTLLVTESIIKNQTIKLDNYGSEFLKKYGYVVQNKNGHYYNFFPIGTPILSLPFVAIANFFGMEMSKSESTIQFIIVLFTSVLTFFSLFKIALIFVNSTKALMLSSVFWFGTSFSSTLGTALWSHNFAVLFALWAIYITVKMINLNIRCSCLALSLILFISYLCRPTMALLSILILISLFFYNRTYALKTGFYLVIFFGCFVVFSLLEFGAPLPDYYLPMRLNGENFLEAMYGNLMSPSRGLFIFSPFLLFILGVAMFSTPKFSFKSFWILIGLVWPILHLVLISTFAHWWGGYSFGSRLMVDVLPGLFLLSVNCNLNLPKLNAKSRLNVLLFPFLIISSFWSVLINSGQGLYNIYASEWNKDPNIDKFKEYLFDWSYPQFFANQESHENRIIRHGTKHNSKIVPNKIIGYNSDQVTYLGWYGPENEHRWTPGPLSRVHFMVDLVADKYIGELSLDMGSLGRQRVEISLNESVIYSGVLNSWHISRVLNFSPNLIRNGMNYISFNIPDARKPGKGINDSRILGIAIRSFTLR